MNFALYHHPRYGGIGITKSWLRKAFEASRARERHPYSEFDRFTALWTAFNAWGMCVTLAESDALMLKELKGSREVAEVFRHVVGGGRFRDRFTSVAASFPLPSFSDLLRINLQYDWRGPRDDAFWAEIGRGTAAGHRVRISPRLSPENPVWKDVHGMRVQSAL